MSAAPWGAVTLEMKLAFDGPLKRCLALPSMPAIRVFLGPGADHVANLEWKLEVGEKWGRSGAVVSCIYVRAGNAASSRH